VPGEGPAVTPAGRAESPPVDRLDGALGHPWGGDAARVTGPGVAAAVSVPSGAGAAITASPAARQADADPAAGPDEAVA
jgi:hypothetical protein